MCTCPIIQALGLSLYTNASKSMSSSALSASAPCTCSPLPPWWSAAAGKYTYCHALSLSSAHESQTSAAAHFWQCTPPTHLVPVLLRLLGGLQQLLALPCFVPLLGTVCQDHLTLKLSHAHEVAAVRGIKVQGVLIHL